MPNSYFQFKQFIIYQDRCAMKVTTDGCLFGAWAAGIIQQQFHYADTILDVGAGTGLLSLMLAQKTRNPIHSVEIVRDAGLQARENYEASPWRDRLALLDGDARVYGFQNRYDIIISNPPFYEKEIRAEEETKNKAMHDGALLFRELVQVIKINLAAAGRFFVLLPYKRLREMESILTGEDLFVLQKTLVRPTTRHGYFRCMMMGGNLPGPQGGTVLDELAIKNEKGGYTEAFTRLLKDYYLNL